MAMPHRIAAAERRARLADRHHLAPEARASDALVAARDMVGLHGTDPGSVYLSALARVPAMTVEDLQRSLYDDRALLRILGMRRTMFVVPHDLAAVIQAACGRAIAARERRRTLQFIEQAGIATDASAWLAAAESATLKALQARREALATELTQDVPQLKEQVQFGIGKKWQGTVGMSTRVLFLLAADWKIIRARPRGSWISGQYRWAPLASWLPAPLPELETDAARVDLVRRWLSTFGPGTLADLRWWTGWNLGDVRRALAEIKPAEVALDGETGLVLPDDLAPTPHPDPWVAFLPALDPTVMGWSKREWFLGGHAPALFDTNGNAGPTVWWEGRVVGGWGQTPSGEVVYQLLEDIGAEAVALVEAEAARLGAWLGGVRVTPRFRTPLEQELAGGTLTSRSGRRSRRQAPMPGGLAQ